MIRQHPVLTTITVLYLAVVGWLTLGPQPTGVVHAAGIWQLLSMLQQHPSLAWIHYSTVEFSANIAMFGPMGLLALLILGRRRWWAAVLVGPALSLAIELAQRGIPGRVPDMRDLVANSLGALAGVLLGLVATWPAARRARVEQAAIERATTGGIRPV